MKPQYDEKLPDAIRAVMASLVMETSKTRSL